MNPNRTMFGEIVGSAFASNMTFAENFKNNFRQTGYASKPKQHNHMLRTTMGLKDEASSDTVSTEFNYL